MNAIQKAIEVFTARSGFRPMHCKKEMKELPTLLHDGEQLLGLLESDFKDVHKSASSGYGLVIATDRRVFCYRKSIFNTVMSEEFQLSKITGISYRKGMMFGSVIITVAGNEAIFGGSGKSEAEKFANVVKDLLSRTNEFVPVVIKSNDADELERLFELKQKGALTDDEFAAAKARLLL